MSKVLYKILVEDAAEKFLLKRDPKQYKQLAVRIFLLSREPRPHDSKILKSHPGLRSLNQGEFRIIYVIHDQAQLILVRRVGKRNDDEVYRGL